MNKQADRLLKMPGKLDRGPVDFETRISRQEGEIMAVATRDVISVTPTIPILEAVKTMTECGFRRLPVTDAGTRRLRGIVTAGDIIDLMGGGSKFNLVKRKHAGNLLAAINDSIREIMTQQVITIQNDARIADAVSIIIEKKIGGIPITDDEGILEGIVTERDVMRILCSESSMVPVEAAMSRSLRVTTPESTIGMATREMLVHKFRRLPVVADGVLFGIVTSSDIIRYLGNGQIFQKLVTGDVAEVMGLPVRTLVCGDLHTIEPDRTISEAASVMLSRGVGALPVIEDARLVGIITEHDLVKAFSGV
ncbi:MAG: CBS domain-containing protein [Methanomicrobiales archaeon]|nr:CBS domain-containing protein [Methanomicrobiales archaeon]